MQPATKHVLIYGSIALATVAVGWAYMRSKLASAAQVATTSNATGTSPEDQQIAQLFAAEQDLQGGGPDLGAAGQGDTVTDFPGQTTPVTTQPVATNGGSSLTPPIGDGNPVGTEPVTINTGTST